jgi:DNA-binding GntR family transcriptional regulator
VRYAVKPNRGLPDLTDVGNAYRTQQAAVADELRRLILTGQLVPGTRLMQAAVAEWMRTSTTPVREAMRQLIAEGLLDADAHRGAVVHSPTSEELDEIYSMRMLLEPLSIVRTVRMITEADIDDADRLLTRMEQEGDMVLWVNMNREFHALLGKAAQSPILQSVLTNLRDRSAPYVAMWIQEANRIPVGNREHRALLDACRARDEALAVETVKLHLEPTTRLGEAQLAGREQARP